MISGRCCGVRSLSVSGLWTFGCYDGEKTIPRAPLPTSTRVRVLLTLSTACAWLVGVFRLVCLALGVAWWSSGGLLWWCVLVVCAVGVVLCARRSGCVLW